MTTTDQSWRLRAKCRTDPEAPLDDRWIDPTLIEVPEGANAEKWRSMTALAMCSGCPVIEQCQREIVEFAELDQVKGGYRLSSIEWKAHKQHNEIRAKLGIPIKKTHLETLEDRFPALCAGGCGHMIRIWPMAKADYPDTRIGTVSFGLCYLCEAEKKAERS